MEAKGTSDYGPDGAGRNKPKGQTPAERESE